MLCNPCGCLNGTCSESDTAICCPCNQKCKSADGQNDVCCNKCTCRITHVVPFQYRCSPCGCLNGVCNVNGNAECCPCEQGECIPAGGGNSLCCEDCLCGTNNVVPGGKRCSPCGCLNGVCNVNGKDVVLIIVSKVSAMIMVGLSVAHVCKECADQLLVKINCVVKTVNVEQTQ